MMQGTKVLDCTLRDGGYYTCWDFDRQLVKDYAQVVQRLPIDVVEIGYRAPPCLDRYYGEYYYLPLRTIERLHGWLNGSVDLAVMLNARDCQTDDVVSLLEGCERWVKYVRMAVAPDGIQHGIDLAREIKRAGYQVTLNLMYMHTILEDQTILHALEREANNIDCVYFVDSYGSCLPQQVRTLIAEVKLRLPQKIGFHGHDNISLAFANALAAIEAGADIVDGTMLGIGRGAGNARTELLTAYLGKQNAQSVDYSDCSELLEKFEKLREQYRWGSSVPYIVSGLERLPQKDVMEWIGKRRYSTTTIVRILQGSCKKYQNNGKLYPLIHDKKKLLKTNSGTALIVGGGDNALRHADAILEYANAHRAIIIYSSLKNVGQYTNESTPQLVCLAGQESQKLRGVEQPVEHISMFVVSAPPRIEQEIPDAWQERVVAVEPFGRPLGVGAEKTLDDISPLGLSLGVVRDLGVKKVLLAGFDGYPGKSMDEMVLAEEVQSCIDLFRSMNPAISINSITPTLYKIPQSSVYAPLE